MDNLSVKNLQFKKTSDKLHESGHKSNYFVLLNGLKVSIKIDNVYIPFGYELYNNRTVLNIEINPKKSNEHSNIYSYISSFENEFADVKNIKSKEMLHDIDGKEYYHNMRKSKGGYIIRTYVYGMPEIYMMIGKFKNLITSSSIKNTISNIELYIGTVWITDTDYGFVWYIKNIEVVKSL